MRIRSLRKKRAFTAAAVLTLAIGHRRDDRDLQRGRHRAAAAPAVRRQRSAGRAYRAERPRNLPGINYQEYVEWRSRTTTLESMAALTFNPLIMATREGTVRLTAAVMSPNYFEVLGVSAELGRVIGSVDEANSTSSS